ncbi:MAG: aldo/keto reductase [Gemmataceae bacterium]
MPPTSIDATVALHNGVAMPWLGLGTWQAADGSEVERAILEAIKLGYRSIDTASIYGNEVGVGNAVRNGGLPRDQLFITSKVWNSDQGFENTLRAFDASMQRLGLDYLDLYLVHWPVQGKYRDTWKALEKLYADQRVRAIGVSNFLTHHLDDLLPGVRVVPMVNQVEFHPWLVQPKLLDYCRQRKIQVEAWAPLMRGRFADIPEITAIARQHQKSPAQVLLRWDLQHEVVTIPKSTSAQRLAENAALFDFSLSAAEMAQLDALECGQRVGPDPDNFNF